MLQSLTYGKTIIAIEHSFIEGEAVYFCLQLKRKKKGFEFLKGNKYTSLEACIKQLKKGSVVSLAFTNKGIISKKTNNTFDNAVEAAKSTFPTLKTNEFYIDIANFGKNSLITVCRKEIIDKVLATYEKHQIHIAGFRIGNGACSLLSNHLNLYHYNTATAAISVDEKTLKHSVHNNSTSTKYTIDGIEISSEYLLSFAASISFYSQIPTLTNYNELLQNQKSLSLQHRTFKLGMNIGLGVIFSMLLINFLFYSHYQKRKNNLEIQVQYNQSYQQEMQALKNKVNLQKELFTNITENSDSRVSFYLDDLAKDIPNSILLSQLFYQPLSKKIKAGKEVLFDTDKIVISGTASKGKEFNNWMHVLEAKPWVSSTSVIDYGTGKNTNTSFTIYLHL